MQAPPKNIGPHPDFPACQVVCDSANDFCYTWPYPTSQQLAEYYESEYRQVRQESPDPEYLDFMDFRARSQIEFITRSSRKCHFESSLDIGCGAGRLVSLLAQVSKSSWGFEADRMMADFAKTTNSAENIRIYHQLFDPETFNSRVELVTMSHVLEHVPNPIEFLKRLRDKTLIANGFLFIEVPNDPGYWVEKQVKWKWRGLAHVNYFTHRSLGNSLIDAGYRVLAIRSCGSSLSEHIARRRPRTYIERGLKKVFPFLSRSRPQGLSYASPEKGNDAIYLQLLAVPA